MVTDGEACCSRNDELAETKERDTYTHGIQTIHTAKVSRTNTQIIFEVKILQPCAFSNVAVVTSKQQNKEKRLSSLITRGVKFQVVSISNVKGSFRTITS